MGYLATPQGMMETAAKKGRYGAIVPLTEELAERFRELGIYVEDLKQHIYQPRNYIASWKNSAVKCEDVNLLDENSDEYIFPQKLWITSTKNKVSS